jgi:hypothetical protein
MSQTKNQFLEKMEELLNSARANMRINAEKAFNSGALNPEAFEDNYILPKIVLVACLENEADQWRPQDKKHRREIANLRHFI